MCQPDVVCMQETKLADTAFPAMAFSALGYESVHHGEGRWNGVAILSRVGLDDVVHGFGDGQPADAEARLLTATCGGVRVMSAYVPNGRALDHEHYQYKLRWLDRLVGPPRRRRRSRRPGGGLRRLQHRPDRSRRVGRRRPRRRHPREPARARGAAEAARLGPHRRLPRLLPRHRSAVLVVGLPGRQLPQGHRHAHRPGARVAVASPIGCAGRSSTATPARARCRPITRRSSSTSRTWRDRRRTPTTVERTPRVRRAGPRPCRSCATSSRRPGGPRCSAWSGAIRDVLHRMVQTSAPNEVIEAVADDVEAAAGRFAPYSGKSMYEGFAEAANAGEPFAFFDHSPMLGQANPLAPPIELWLDGRPDRGRRHLRPGLRGSARAACTAGTSPPPSTRCSARRSRCRGAPA